MTQKQKPAKPRAQRTATRYRVVRVDSFRWAIDDTSRPRILLALCFKAADARLICRALNRRQET